MPRRNYRRDEDPKVGDIITSANRIEQGLSPLEISGVKWYTEYGGKKAGMVHVKGKKGDVLLGDAGRVKDFWELVI